MKIDRNILKQGWILLFLIPPIIGRSEWILPLVLLGAILYYGINTISRRKKVKRGEYLIIGHTRQSRLQSILMGLLLGVPWIVIGVLKKERGFDFVGISYEFFLAALIIIIGIGGIRTYSFILTPTAIKLNELVPRTWSYSQITYVIIRGKTIIFFSRKRGVRSKFDNISRDEMHYLRDFFIERKIPLQVRGKML